MLSLTESGFSADSAKRMTEFQRASTRAVYEGKWREFCSWCDRKKIDSLEASVPQIADFLMIRYEKQPPLAINSYRSVIVSVLNVRDDIDVSSSPHLQKLLKKMSLERPVIRNYYINGTWHWYLIHY